MLRECLSPRNALIALAVFGMAGCASNVEPPPVVDTSPPPRKPESHKRTTLAPGDQIELFVLEDTQFNGLYKVREGGDIIVPKYGRIEVSGMSVPGAEGAVKRALEKDQLKKATVIVDRVSMAQDTGTVGVEGKVQVFLSGRVTKPGMHMIVPPHETLGVSEALMITGGVSRYGDERKVYIMRRKQDGSQMKIPVDVSAIQAGNGVRDVPVQSGDIIVVPEKGFVL